MMLKKQGIFGNSGDESIILEGSSFKGTIFTDGAIKILGEVNGSHVKADKVFIKNGARVKSNLEVNNALVEGIYIGDIKADVRVVLASTAKVLGNITTKELFSSEGVLFQGSCKVSNENLGDIGKHVQNLFNEKYNSE